MADLVDQYQDDFAAALERADWLAEEVIKRYPHLVTQDNFVLIIQRAKDPYLLIKAALVANKDLATPENFAFVIQNYNKCSFMVLDASPTVATQENFALSVRKMEWGLSLKILAVNPALATPENFVLALQRDTKLAINMFKIDPHVANSESLKIAIKTRVDLGEGVKLHTEILKENPELATEEILNLGIESNLLSVVRPTLDANPSLATLDAFEKTVTHNEEYTRLSMLLANTNPSMGKAYSLDEIRHFPPDVATIFAKSHMEAGTPIPEDLTREDPTPLHWAKHFGARRIPQDKGVLKLSVDRIEKFAAICDQNQNASRRAFDKMVAHALKEVDPDMVTPRLQPHEAEALMNLAEAWDVEAPNYLARLKKNMDLGYHDAGINLKPSTPYTQEQRAFAMRTATSKSFALGQNALNNWDYLLENGWSPEGANALAHAEELLTLRQIPDAGAPVLVQASAQAGYSLDEANQTYYLQMEDRWLRSLENQKQQRVPAPLDAEGKPFEVEGMRLVMLPKDDPRTVLAGAFTGCCQHPQGVGAESAWHAQESPDGAVWAVLKNNKEGKEVMVAQAWAWRHEDNLVLDSLEMAVQYREGETPDHVRALFGQGAQAIVQPAPNMENPMGRMGINRVFCGTGCGGSLAFDPEKDTSYRDFPAPKERYNESHNCWTVADNGLKMEKPMSDIPYTMEEEMRLIKEMEARIYPKELQSMQSADFHTPGDVNPGSAVYTSLFGSRDKPTGYAILEDRGESVYIYDLATEAPLSLKEVKDFMKDTALLAGNRPIEMHARNSTSHRLMEFATQKGLLDLQNGGHAHNPEDGDSKTFWKVTASDKLKNELANHMEGDLTALDLPEGMQRPLREKEFGEATNHYENDHSEERSLRRDGWQALQDAIAHRQEMAGLGKELDGNEVELAR